MTPEPSEDALGFDENAHLDADDVVVLEQADGTRLACVLLAVVEHGGRTYALLSPRLADDPPDDDGSDDDEGEILVTTYDEDPEGGVRVGPLDDEGVLDALEGIVKDLLGVGDAPGRRSPHDPPVPEA